MISVVATKVIVLISLFVLSLLFSVLPLKLIQLSHTNNDRRRNIILKALSLLSCFSAGVFLATCLMDLFPDVQEKIDAGLSASGIFTSFPLSQFVVLVGLFLIIFLEQFVMMFQQDHGHSHGYAPLFSDDEHEDIEQVPHHNDDNDHQQHHVSPPRHNHHRRQRQPSSPQGMHEPLSFSRSISASMNSDTMSVTSSVSISPVPPTPPRQSMIRSFVLLLALSFHSVFEGIAVGLQDTRSSVLQITLALSVHKLILAFSLGLSLSRSGRSVATVLKSCLMFCAMSPLGIGIGIGIQDLTSHNSQTTHLVNGTMLGVACGTFLYVVFFEIIPREFSSDQKPDEDPVWTHRSAGLLKVLLMLLGFVTVSAVLFLHPAEHPSDLQPT